MLRGQRSTSNIFLGKEVLSGFYEKAYHVVNCPVERAVAEASWEEALEL